MSKAFDWVNRDLLFLGLLQYGVDGKFYRTIKTLYRNKVSCVKINNCNTEWFEISSGVRQYFVTKFIFVIYKWTRSRT